MKKINDLEVNIGDKTYVIEIKSKKQKLKEKNYKPEVWYDGVEKYITETRSFWEEPSFIKLLTEDAKVKKIILDNFGSLDVAVKEIKKYKPQTDLAKAMSQVRKATQPLKETLDKINIIPEALKELNKQWKGTPVEEVMDDVMFAKITANKAELIKEFGKPFLDAYESYKKGKGKKSRDELANFLKDKRKKELKSSIKKKMVSSTTISEGKPRKAPTSFLGSLIKERKLTTIPTLDLATNLKGMKANKKAPYDRPPIIGTGLKSYMARQKPPLKSPVDVIKAFKKDKSLKVKSWENLVWFLRQMNYEPDEVFEYALTAVSGTKERWNRHRIFREFETNESGAIEDMCKYYRAHLKGKHPLKTFYGNDFYRDWCINNNVIFKSIENFRQCLKGMVKAYNKKYPKDKIPEKLK